MEGKTRSMRETYIFQNACTQPILPRIKFIWNSYILHMKNTSFLRMNRTRMNFIWMYTHVICMNFVCISYILNYIYNTYVPYIWISYILHIYFIHLRNIYVLHMNFFMRITYIKFKCCTRLIHVYFIWKFEFIICIHLKHVLQYNKHSESIA